MKFNHNRVFGLYTSSSLCKKYCESVPLMMLHVTNTGIIIDTSNLCDMNDPIRWPETIYKQQKKQSEGIYLRKILIKSRQKYILDQ